MKYRSTRRLQSILRKFVCVTWMSYNQMSSLNMTPLYKRISANTATLSIQSGRKQIPARRSITNNLSSQRHTMRQLSSRQTRLWIKLNSRAATLEMVVVLEEGHLPGQMWLVTSVAKKTISRKTASQRKLDIVGTHTRNQQMNFQNG